MKKLLKNNIVFDIEGDEILEDSRYVLFSRNRKNTTITAPLYEYNSEKEKYDLISDTYTGEVVDPVEEYELIKETYS